MKPIFRIFLSVLFLATAQAKHIPASQLTGDGCNLRINHNVLKKQPLILKQIQGNEKHYEFDEPDKGDAMLFESGETVLLACPGSELINTHNTVIRVNCIGNTEFYDENNNEERSFENFQCDRVPRSKLKREGQCADDKSAFVVGFEVGEEFVKTIDICFDESTNSALYAKHKITPNITGSQRHGLHVSFREGDLFSDVAVDKAYKRANQKIVFGKIVSRSAVNQYINSREFLDRGHLAPKADFIFDSQQAATFYYANVRPQWHTFNSGNWERLELAIRKFVIDRHLQLTIYTGTYGTYEINGTKMFLASDSYGLPTIPIPQVFWKVVFDERNGRAVAFVGLNDPYADPNDNSAMHLCSVDVCHLIRWVNFKPIPKSGLMYCCEIDDFSKTVKTLPPIENVYGLLDS